MKNPTYDISGYYQTSAFPVPVLLYLIVKCLFLFLQIGAENAQLQKVLDTFDAIKTKVRLPRSSSHLAPFLPHLCILSSNHRTPAHFSPAVS